MEVVVRAGTAGDTRGVGEVLAGLLRVRDVVSLTGELGAGKTTLVQGIAAGLGVQEHVASPTFTLVREYVTGRLPVAHVDVYRLQRVQEVVDLALDELSGGDGVLIVEWGDAVEALLDEERLRVELTLEDPGEEARRIALSARGESWRERWSVLTEALAPWGTNA